MADSAAPSLGDNSEIGMPAKVPLLVGCLVRIPRGPIGRVIEIGNRNFRLDMGEGVKKQFLLSYLHKFAIVQDVMRSGREGRMLMRLSKPRPVSCDRCEKPLTDLVSIAIGLGPSCRTPRLDAQKARWAERYEAWFETRQGADEEAASAAFDDIRNDEEAARFLIWLHGLDV